MSHADRMDRIYRFQRHFYDATRPLFLFGRDRLLDAVELHPGMSLLEVGCGTARNLVKLARRHPRASFYGVDISSEMLGTARVKVAAAGLADRIALAQCAAESVRYQTVFERGRPFDAVLFSYSLSMMPTCHLALAAARANLSPVGAVYAVDFWDGLGWPAPFRGLAARWLSLFHVRFGADTAAAVSACFPETEIRAVKGRYAFMALPRRRSAQSTGEGLGTR